MPVFPHIHSLLFSDPFCTMGVRKERLGAEAFRLHFSIGFCLHLANGRNWREMERGGREKPVNFSPSPSASHGFPTEMTPSPWLGFLLDRPTMFHLLPGGLESRAPKRMPTPSALHTGAASGCCKFLIASTCLVWLPSPSTIHRTNSLNSFSSA